jgi:hypothetical protein
MRRRRRSRAESLRQHARGGPASPLPPGHVFVLSRKRVLKIGRNGLILCKTFGKPDAGVQYMSRLPRARKRSYHVTITLGGGVGPLPDVNAACRTAPRRSAPRPATHMPVPSLALLLLCARDLTGRHSLPTIALVRCDCCALSRGSPVCALGRSRRRASASRASPSVHVDPSHSGIWDCSGPRASHGPLKSQILITTSLIGRTIQPLTATSRQLFARCARRGPSGGNPPDPPPPRSRMMPCPTPRKTPRKLRGPAGAKPRATQSAHGSLRARVARGQYCHNKRGSAGGPAESQTQTLCVYDFCREARCETVSQTDRLSQRVMSRRR